MKTITLDGITFAVKGTLNSVPYYTPRDLSDCYARPSHIKKLVWHSWCNKLAALGFKDISVRSYNINIFTIKAWKDDAYVEIFPTHNDYYNLS